MGETQNCSWNRGINHKFLSHVLETETQQAGNARKPLLGGEHTDGWKSQF